MDASEIDDCAGAGGSNDGIAISGHPSARFIGQPAAGAEIDGLASGCRGHDKHTEVVDRASRPRDGDGELSSAYHPGAGIADGPAGMERDSRRDAAGIEDGAIPADVSEPQSVPALTRFGSPTAGQAAAMGGYSRHRLSVAE